MRSILIVEDDYDIRETLIDVFSNEGYIVLGASNGRDGLQIMQKHRPDLVLLDLMMPVLSGWEFLKIVAQDPDLKSIPVVVMSAAASEPQPKPSAFIKKPISLDTLLPIASHLSGDEAREKQLAG